MNSKMILISVLVVAVFFSTALTPVFADNTGACGIEKKDIIKSIIAYITQNSDISQNQVVFLFKGYLGALNCGNADLVEAKDKADNIDEEIIPKCSDGTMLAHCSHNTPKYCYSGKLIDRCDLCCDSGRCGVNSQCEGEVNIVDCAQEYGSEYFCGTYKDWVGQCQSVGQIKKLAYSRCSDATSATQYCIKCEEPQETIDCTQQYGNDYWCSTYDEWKAECLGRGETVELANTKCHDYGDIYKGYCSTCVSSEAECHKHENPSWIETNDYEIQVIEKGCTGSYGDEYLIELRNDFNSAGVEHCGERLWVWFEAGSTALESGKCYRVNTHTNTVTGHMIVGVGEEINCPVCENTACHKHENPAWLESNDYDIHVIEKGCTSNFGDEYLVEIKKTSDPTRLETCSEQTWVWLEAGSTPLESGKCYRANFHTNTVTGHMIVGVGDEKSCPVCESTSCTDTDSGKNYYVKGEIYWSTQDFSATDVCRGDYVLEYYCEGDMYKQIVYQCPSSCKDGACTKTPYCHKPSSEEDWTYKVSYLGDSVDLPAGWFTEKSAGNGLLYRGDKTTPEELFSSCSDEIDSIWHYDFISGKWSIFSFSKPGFTDLYEILDGEIYSISMNKTCVLKHPDPQGSFWKSTYCENGCENGVCTNSVPDESNCHTHTNPAWIEDGTHRIKIVDTGCTQVGCAEGDHNGTEVLIELREGAFCGEQVWVWLDTGMTDDAPKIGNCYMAEIFTKMYGPDCGHVIRYLIAPTECLDCDGSVTEYGNRCAEDAECTPPLVCQTSGRYDKLGVYTEEYCCNTNECASVISGPCVSLGGTDIKDAEYPHMTLECVFNNDMQRAEYIVDCGNTFGPEFWCGTYDSWVGQCGSLGEIKELSSPGCSLGNGEAQYCIKCA